MHAYIRLCYLLLYILSSRITLFVVNYALGLQQAIACFSTVTAILMIQVIELTGWVVIYDTLN